MKRSMLHVFVVAAAAAHWPRVAALGTLSTVRVSFPGSFILMMSMYSWL